MKIIENYIVSSVLSLLDAMKLMDKLGTKTLFVFDDKKFLGLLTIGDIQRAIINNIDINSAVGGVLGAKKIYAKETDSIEKIKQMMSSIRSECMPVLSGDGNLVNVYFWKDLFGLNEEPEREKLDLPVVIMAGGFGTRLKPLTNVIPKPLIPLGDKTILEEIMDQFEKIGTSKFYMSVNYKYDMIEFYLNQLEHKYDISFFRESKPLGTIGSVSLLKDKINTPFFVSNCDIIIDQDYRDVYEYHKNNGNDITIVTAVMNYNIPYGVIETKEDGVMVGLSEKPNIAYKINTGVYILQPELINEIPEDTFFHITHLMEKVIARGGKVGCFPVSENSWTDIGDWREYIKKINI